jgi:phenylacetate-CoA ligase
MEHPLLLRRMLMKPFRLSDYFKLNKILRFRWLMWRSQFFPLERIRILQWNWLSGLLDHCFQSVPYYRDLFKKMGIHRSDIRSLEDVQIIPILDKNTVRENYGDLRADNFREFKTSECHTCGTTGTPLRPHWDLNSNVVTAMGIWRHLSWAGYRLGNSFLDVRTCAWDFSKEYLWTPWCRGLEFSIDRINPSNIGRFAQYLRKYRIKFWRGHPPAMCRLAQLLLDAGIENVKPKFLVPQGLSLHQYQREFLELWSNAPVCDYYSMVERCVQICQCPDGGYHTTAELGLVEIIKEDGTPAQPGEEGRIVATGFHNFAFPFLRYDTGDLAIQSDTICQCGRTLPLIENVTGRIDDYVTDADGKQIAALHLPLYFARGVRMAQVVQEKKGVLDVYIVPSEDFNLENQSFIIHEFRKFVGRNMQIHIHEVCEVPYHQPGKKFKFVVSMLSGS